MSRTGSEKSAETLDWVQRGPLKVIILSMVKETTQSLPPQESTALGRVSRFVFGAALLMASLGFCEWLSRLLPVLDIEFRQTRNEERFLRTVKLNPLWGFSFVPNIDVFWDDTSRERQKMAYRFRTVPIPGYEHYGMRDDGWNPRAQRTIAVLGDSFSFGTSVDNEDIWCERIEARNPQIDMLNLATGSGIAKAVLEYQVLRDRVPAHQAVVYEMYLGNEFLDNSVFSEFVPGNMDEEIASQEATHRRLRLLGFSKLLFGAYTLASRSKAALLGSRTRATEYAAEADGYWDERFGNFLLKPKNPILLRYAEMEYSDERISKGIAETERAMRRMRDLVGNRRFVILLFPFKEMIHFDAIRDHVNDIDIGKPSRIVLELCRKNNISCADLTPGIQPHANEKLYWDYDHHFNKLGQFYAAQVAEQALKENGIIPPSQ